MRQDYCLTMRRGFETSQVRKNVPILSKIPNWLARRMTPVAKTALGVQGVRKASPTQQCELIFRSQDCYRQVENIKQARTSSQNGHAEKPKPSLFSDILDSNLPPQEKETQRIADEAFVVIIAGSESTARTISVMVYHTLANPDILQRLRAELDEAIPNANAETPLTTVEALPYLMSKTNH